MSFILLGILNSQAAGAVVVGVAGYVAGGTTNTNVIKISFPDDTVSTLATGISSPRNQGVGFSNPSVAGYAAGGADGSNNPTSTVDKFSFPDDTRTTLGTGLNTARSQSPAGFYNPVVAGYVAGGSSGVALSSVEKFAFPDDTRSTLATGLSTATRLLSGFSNPSVAGYTAGGNPTNDSNTQTTTVNKFAFPGESRTTLATGLSLARQTAAGFSNPSVAGYVAGGFNGSSRVTTVDKFAFADDTRATLATGLSSARDNAPGFSNPSVAGYVAGGFTGSSDVDTVDKFDFATDTRTTTTSLPAARSQSAGFQDA